jgi:hypothetical protein
MRGLEVHLGSPFCLVFIYWGTTPFWELYTLYLVLARSRDFRSRREDLIGIHYGYPMAS